MMTTKVPSGQALLSPPLPGPTPFALGESELYGMVPSNSPWKSMRETDGSTGTAPNPISGLPDTGATLDTTSFSLDVRMWQTQGGKKIANKIAKIKSPTF